MILMVCYKKACKEYTIEKNENGVTTLILNKRELALMHSIALQIEVIDGRLMAACDNTCSFIRNGRALRTVDIRDDEVFTLDTRSGERLCLVFAT